MNENDVFCSNCKKAVTKKEKTIAVEKKEKKSSKNKYIGMILAAVIVAVLMKIFVFSKDNTENITAETDVSSEEYYSVKEEEENEALIEEQLESVDLTGTWTGYVSSQTEDVSLVIDENNHYEWVKTGDRSSSVTVYDEAPPLNRGRWYETIFRGTMESLGAGEYKFILEDYDDYIKINNEELIYLKYQTERRFIDDSALENSVDTSRQQLTQILGSLTEIRFLQALNDYREGTSIKDSRINRIKYFYYHEMFTNAVVSEDEELLVLTYFSYQNPTEYMETIKTDPDLGGHDTLEDFLKSFNEKLGNLKVIDENTIELGYDYSKGYETITLTRQ